MNFEEIKSGFIQYYLDKQAPSGQNEVARIEQEENFNIFSHFSEFKEYLVKENIADSSIYTASLSDLKSMQVEDGKLVAKKEGEEGEGEENSDDSNLMVDLLNDLFSQDDVIEALDADKSGELDMEEMSAFLDKYSQTDEEGNVSISMDDIEDPIEKFYMLNELYEDPNNLKYFDKNHDGVVDIDEKRSFREAIGDENGEVTIQDIKNISEAMKNNFYGAGNINNTQNYSAAPAYAAGGGSYSGYANYGGTNSAASTPQTPSYITMSLDDLNSAQSTKEGEIASLNNELQAVYDGSDSEVKAAQEAADEAQNTYEEALENDEEVNTELKEQEQELIQNISDKQSEIDDTNSTIADLNQTIASLESTISADESNLDALKSALAALPSSGSSNYPEDEGKIADVEAKRTQLNSEIAKAQSQLDSDKAELESTKDDLAENETTLESLEEEMAALQSDKEELEAKILDSCSEETKQALNAYNDAAKNVEAVKESRINKINEAIEAQQTELNEINEAINTKNAQATKKEYKFSNGELFDPDAKITTQYIDDGTTMPYLLIAPEGADPNEELPVLVYLHGMGEVKPGEACMYSTHGPGGIMTEEAGWDLSTFNGYIICPHLESGNWENATAVNNVAQLLDTFQSEHDTGKTVLMGASLGGSGVIYMAKESNLGSKYFDEAVALSGYRTDVTSDMAIPLTGYVGTQDDPKSIGYMRSGFGDNLNYLNATHGTLPMTLLGMDSDGDGNSDFLQQLFEEQ